LKAEVHCADRVCGTTTYIVINPDTRQVTHLVVKESESPHEERLVPIETVINAGPEKVQIRLTSDQLHSQRPFTVDEFLPGTIPFLTYPAEGYMTWPATGAMPQPLEIQQNPPGTLAIPRGARVEARDGDVGKVDEFLIDPVSDRITHIILREGSLWDKRDVTIPVSQIDRIENNTVYLLLDKREIEDLPATPA
jgi:sporulation protein YlmC with PRC-barrel domain